MTGTTYQDTSVSAQTTYYYVVRAVNATETGGASAEASATPPAPHVAFTDQDIGSPQQAGSLQYATGSGIYTVKGGGAGHRGSSDSFNFACTSLSGNGFILARVTSIQNTSATAEAGVMFRDSTAANAAMAMLAVTPGSGLYFETRTQRRRLNQRPACLRPRHAHLAPTLPRGKRVHGVLFHVHGERPQCRKLGTSRLGRYDFIISGRGRRGAGGYGGQRFGVEHQHVFRRERGFDSCSGGVGDAGRKRPDRASYVDQLAFQFNKPMTLTVAVPMTLTDLGTQGNLNEPVTLTAGQFHGARCPARGPRS